MKPVAPQLLLHGVDMLETIGDVGCTDGEFVHPPEDAEAHSPERIVPNTVIRQTRVKAWIAASEDQPGLKKAGLHEMTYGAGHNCVIIRGSTATDLVILPGREEVSREEAYGYARMER